MSQPWYTYADYAKNTFGYRMVRIPIDAGFTCPNKDGRCGRDGCLFCADGAASLSSRGTIEAQYEAGIAAAARKWGTFGRIPYLQANTNTYAPPAVLRRLYRQCAALPGAEMLAIGTRADCLSPDVLDVLCELAEEIPLHIELGMQSCHDETLRRIRRGYGHDAFVRGYHALRERGGRIRIGLHLMNGLPGETSDHMMETVREAVRLAPDEIKLHTVCVLRGTALAEEYAAGRYTPPERDETVSLVCRQLTQIPTGTVIGRISADAASDILIAPLWVRNKRDFENRVRQKMSENGWQQGCHL